MFNSYEPSRLTGPGYVTLVANYLPLQDAYGGPNYFKLDPNALYEIHVDNNGDGKEDITFQFRFNNTLRGDDADDRRQRRRDPADAVGPDQRAERGRVERQRDLHRRHRARRPPHRHARLDHQRDRRGNNVFAKPVDNIGMKTIPNYAAYAAQHIYTRQHPRLHGTGQGLRRPAQGPVRRQPRRHLRPAQRSGRGRLHARRSRVPARQLEEGRRRTTTSPTPT